MIKEIALTIYFAKIPLKLLKITKHLKHNSKHITYFVDNRSKGKNVESFLFHFNNESIFKFWIPDRNFQV